MTRIGLIDYGMGNLHSVQRAFDRLAPKPGSQKKTSRKKKR